MPEKPSESANFQRAIEKVLTVTKKESDAQMERFQASNKAKREERKPKS